MTAPTRVQKTVDQITPTDVVDVILHGATWPAFLDWVRTRQLRVDPWPVTDDQLPTFMVTPDQ